MRSRGRLLLKCHVPKEDVSGGIGIPISSVPASRAAIGPRSSQSHVDVPASTTGLAGPVLVADDNIGAVFPGFVLEEKLETGVRPGRQDLDTLFAQDATALATHPLDTEVREEDSVEVFAEPLGEEVVHVVSQVSHAQAQRGHDFAHVTARAVGCSGVRCT